MKISSYSIRMAVILASVFVAFVCTSSMAFARPNIILILADDLGYGDLGCYGHPKFKTPNLDRLASQGTRLTHFNCPASFCAPTRSSLMTGRYPFRNGMVQNPAPDGANPKATHELHLAESEITLAQLLKQAGYATAIFGKWHLGHAKSEWLPTSRGFDEYFGIPYSNDMRPVQLLEGKERVEYPVLQLSLTQRYTDRAIAFIEKNKDKPFFLYLPHAMPHKPLAASEAFYKKSGNGLYADVIAELDHGIGQLMNKLTELRLEDNTLVMFTSDNGAWFGGSCGGLRGMKGSTYEGGYRVPCIARWPGKIPAGRVSSELAVSMDLFSTALAAAEVKPPADRVIDGRDLLPMLNGNAKSPHKAIVGAQGNRLACVQDGHWKLHVLPPRDQFMLLNKPGSTERWIDPRTPDGVTIIAPFEQYQPTDHPGSRSGDAPKAMQLFDLQSDFREEHDVSAKNPEVVARLKAAFDAINAEVK
jgi:arylsulfatase A-like enzyme